jgi:large subunit ribosomal protein L31e
MAQTTQTTERTTEKEYVIPLRKKWAKVARYKRTSKSVKAIKEFIARHMRVPDRDTGKVKLDVYLNNELWFKGSNNPPTKIKVRAVKEKEGDVRVELVEIPENVKFLKAKQEKRHKKVEKKKEEKPAVKEKLEDKIEEKKEGEKTEEDKKEEKEKEKSVEQAQIKAAEQAAKVQKHVVKGKEPQVQRKALKK